MRWALPKLQTLAVLWVLSKLLRLQLLPMAARDAKAAKHVHTSMLKALPTLQMLHMLQMLSKLLRRPWLQVAVRAINAFKL